MPLLSLYPFQTKGNPGMAFFLNITGLCLYKKKKALLRNKDGL